MHILLKAPKQRAFDPAGNSSIIMADFDPAVLVRYFSKDHAVLRLGDDFARGSWFAANVYLFVGTSVSLHDNMGSGVHNGFTHPAGGAFEVPDPQPGSRAFQYSQGKAVAKFPQDIPIRSRAGAHVDIIAGNGDHFRRLTEVRTGKKKKETE